MDFKDLITKNEGCEFVVHTQNRYEYDALIDALESLGFEFSLPHLGTLREMAENFASEDGYDVCWRISRERGVAYNPSVEHWKFFVNDIIEVQDEEFVCHEGYISQKAAHIEEKKLRNDLFISENKKWHRRLLGLDKASDAEIEDWLIKKFSQAVINKK